MDIESRQAIDSRLAEIRAVQQIEHAEIEKERIVGLPGKGQRRASSICKPVDTTPIAAIRGRRRRADVVVHRIHGASRQHRPPVLDARHAVGLVHVAIGVVERPNRSDVVEECIRIADPGSEPELIRDVFDAVAGVVNFELVQDVIPEPIEVRPARRILKRNPRRDQGDRVWRIGAHECIYVGGVGLRVAANQWRFAMARRPRGHHLIGDEQEHHRQKIDFAPHEFTPCSS